MTKRGSETYNTVVLLAAWALVTLAGCSQTDPHTGYTSKSLYRTDVKTVFVEMFHSDSLRRNVEYELSRAICQQIELQTPFKLVGNRRKADTILYGNIPAVHERVLSQQPSLDRPLESQIILVADVTWKDLRSGQLLIDNQTFKVSADYAALAGAGRDAPTRQAANEMAARIVETMAEPW